jgi:hypothetical protein
MPKNQVADPITDQEIAFARLVLSGTMTDRRAAEVAGLNPDTAAYTKSKPRVRAYMLEHRAAVREQLVDEDVDLSRRAVDQQRRLNQVRDRVLARLWEIADLDPEKTRGSLCGQTKALAMIAAIEGLIPDRRASSAQNKLAPPPVTPDIYKAAWLRARQAGENIEPHPTPPQEEIASKPSSDGAPPTAEPTPVPPTDVSQESFLAAPGNATPTPALAPRVPMADHVPPDTRVPFSIKRNPFARRRQTY